MHAKLSADNHQGIGNIVSCITEEGQLPSTDIAELFLRCHDVSEHLGRMEIIRQTIPYRDTGILCQFFNNALLVATVLDAVKHAAQNLRGIFQRLFVSHLGRLGIQECDTHAEISCADFKCASCSRRCFFEQQNNLFPLQIAVVNTISLQVLEFNREIDHVIDLFRREVKQGQKASSTNIYAHKIFSFRVFFGCIVSRHAPAAWTCISGRLCLWTARHSELSGH